MTGSATDDTGVDVGLPDGPLLRADYLVGRDGGRSPIRKTAGIELPGRYPTTCNLIGEVELAEEPAWGLRRDRFGIHSSNRMVNGGPVRRRDIVERTR